MVNRIAEIRKARKLSQAKLAERVGITRPYLSEIERGIKTPSVAIAKSLAQILSYSTDDLFMPKASTEA